MPRNKRPIFFGDYDVDFPCVTDPPADRDGNRLELHGGGPDPEPEVVILKWPFAPHAPDFIYSVSGDLFISKKVRRAWELERSSAHSLIPIELIDRGSRTIMDGYWWVNIHTRFSILDESRSKCTKAGPVIIDIERFAVDWEQVPETDLFLCSENWEPVFSENYVQRVREARLQGLDFYEVEGGRWPGRHLL